jgi:hypothetical protein
MDDWISRVYGRHRTTRVDDARVAHQTGSHGTRYSVDPEHGALLEAEVDNGRLQIESWMRNQLAFQTNTYNITVTEEQFKSFQMDNFHFRIGQK